jgi:hypothetical protein
MEAAIISSEATVKSVNNASITLKEYTGVLISVYCRIDDSHVVVRTLIGMK